MITVITVTYNAAAIISETVRSIINQQNCRFEFILVDGASTDNTVNIVTNEISSLDSKNCACRIVSEKDNGIYDAMNKGVRLANGDYVIFMNGGDTFYSNDVLASFEKAISLNQDLDVYYGDTMMHFYEGTGILHDDENSTRNPTMPFIHQSVIVKKERLLQHPFDTSFKICADLEFFYYLRQKKATFLHCPFIVSNYDAKEGLSENNPLQIRYEEDRIFHRDVTTRYYWIRKFLLQCTVGLIQPIKDIAPRCILNVYFRHKKKYITWQ